ncbi:exonuclease subunit SbcD [Pantoea sp. 1.19]|uniref:exonuclease subunit SbcD n=1 Tax=Pantoea sp. 1.19 TaxID=1925589 RepID=UPI0009489626|nr:exonuclease subunit SbcD [Pantoea sp. 1.19]
MRIIHTSDWHLGQFFYTRSRAAEHRAFFRWLIAAVEQHQVDALIVAGDIFDTASPPSYARELYNQFVVDLHATGCQLVILAGNHDSVATLNESRELLAQLNTRVIAAATEAVTGQVITLTQRDGTPGALLCAIPFLRPRDIQFSQAGQSGRDKQRDLLTAIRDHYQRCWQTACERREAAGLEVPIIATGHLTALGVTPGDAVRDIYIGTLDAFPAQAFPPADYIALGHIHRAQQVAGNPRIRYSGSPIPLSFDELGKPKSVVLLTMEGPEIGQIDTLSIPCFQPMAMLSGSLEEVEAQLAALPDNPGGQPTWLDIEVSASAWLSDVQRRIEAMTADRPVEVLLLRRRREQSGVALRGEANETLAELQVGEVFARRLAQESDLDGPQRARLQALFNATLSAIDEEPPR